MIKLSLEESKKTQVEILLYIDKICKEHNIHYSLAYGTLLGAVRHKGFIPWDDDIDIMLLRNDYDILLRLLSSDADYNLVYEKTNNNWYTYAKLCDKRTYLREDGYPEIETLGVFVDIFPMDFIPDNKIERFFYAKTLYLFDRLIYTSVSKNFFRSTSFIKTIIKTILFTPLALVSKSIGTKKLVNTTLRLMQKHNALLHCKDTLQKCNDKNMNYVGFLPNKYGYKEVFPVDWFENLDTLEFEGYSLSVISEYKSYLSLLYKNYMQPPPEDKRVSNHVFTSYWREDR
jgi:lipopolysaccharide cholinephosphotransferase